MCTDKWRNLLKEFKKAKHHDGGGSGSAKMSYYKEIEDILRERNRSTQYKSSTPSSTKVDSFMQFSDKGTSPFHFLLLLRVLLNLLSCRIYLMHMGFSSELHTVEVANPRMRSTFICRHIRAPFSSPISSLC